LIHPAVVALDFFQASLIYHVQVLPSLSVYALSVVMKSAPMHINANIVRTLMREGKRHSSRLQEGPENLLFGVSFSNPNGP
jgi:hypothetical protein